jgi:hypothetical protein
MFTLAERPMPASTAAPPNANDGQATGRRISAPSARIAAEKEGIGVHHGRPVAVEVSVRPISLPPPCGPLPHLPMPTLQSKTLGVCPFTMRREPL